MTDAAADAGDTLVLELSPPIKVKGGECSSLTLREPRARHVRDAEKKLDARMSEQSVTEHDIALVASCAGVDDDVVRAMPVRKIGAAVNWLLAFVKDPFIDLDDDPLDDLPDAEFEIIIDPPIVWQKLEYPRLTLREPTADEMRRARVHTSKAITPYTIRCREMELIRLVSGLHPAVIDGLRIRTQVEASRQLARFIEAGRRAGKGSSSS